MATFLNENQIGMDVVSIGFPSLGDCMGVLVETPTAIYGFHHMPNPPARAGALQGFIASKMDDITNATRLYGCARFGRRYGQSKTPNSQWKTEMEGIANAIGYSGHVIGVNLSKASHTPKDKKANATVFLEFIRGGTTAAGCTIKYKRMSKMAVTPGVKTGPHGIVGVRMNNATGGYMTGASPHAITSGVYLDTTKTNSIAGIMHVAGKFITFTH